MQTSKFYILRLYLPNTNKQNLFWRSLMAQVPLMKIKIRKVFRNYPLIFARFILALWLFPQRIVVCNQEIMRHAQSWNRLAVLDFSCGKFRAFLNKYQTEDAETMQFITGDDIALFSLPLFYRFDDARSDPDTERCTEQKAIHSVHSHRISWLFNQITTKLIRHLFVATDKRWGR